MELTFEGSIKKIYEQVDLHRSRWRLEIRKDIDWDDIKQIIVLHIGKKWDMYDQTKPLEPWLNRVITHQIYNLLESHYYTYIKPCQGCAANPQVDGNLCNIYGKQCNECPLYAKWEINRKPAFNVKLPISIEQKDVVLPQTIVEHDYLSDHSMPYFHAKIKEILDAEERTAYEYLYVKHLKEQTVAELMGYKGKAVNFYPGHSEVQSIKSRIIAKVKPFVLSFSHGS